MKILNVVVFILLFCLYSINAQDTIQNNKIYKTWVSLNSMPFKINGVLYEIKDSSILVSNSFMIKDYSADRFKITNLFINEIETIKIRRKNNIGRGILIGAISGIVFGSMLGMLSGDDPPCTGPDAWGCEIFRQSAGGKALAGGVMFAFVGTGTGALIGSFKTKIPIKGSIRNYNSKKNKLREYSVIKK